jgi:hypothetical protein
MDVKQIVLLVFVLLVVIYFIVQAFSKTNKLTEMAEGKIKQTITADSLKNTNNSSNFTYSMWIFVDDWNYLYGQEKTVLERNNGPTVLLGDKPNSLKVKLKYYDKSKNIVGDGGNSTGAAIDTAATSAACDACNAGYSCACDACNSKVLLNQSPEAIAAANAAANAKANAGTSVHTCQIDNVPIQSWVNVVISLYVSTLDVYLNGKLVRTCVLPGVPRVDNNVDINVTSGGGFSGWTSSFKYWANASNPQEVYNIYKDGFGGSILGNALSKYRLRFSMVKDNTEQGSFEI